MSRNVLMALVAMIACYCMSFLTIGCGNECPAGNHLNSNYNCVADTAAPTPPPATEGEGEGEGAEGEGEGDVSVRVCEDKDGDEYLDITRDCTTCTVGDGSGGTIVVIRCPLVGRDCDDNDAMTYPGAAEI